MGPHKRVRICWYFIIVLLCISTVEAVNVSLVCEMQPGGPIKHGLEKVKQALDSRGVSFSDVGGADFLIVIDLEGFTSTGSKIFKRLQIDPPRTAEGLLVRNTNWKDTRTLFVSGGDERGLMYALLDIADRITWSRQPDNPFSEVRDVSEKPYVSERASSMYTMNKANFESFFYDVKHWERYLDMLAANRFNTFALLFGYENHGYFSPPYPQFFDVEEFGDIHVVGVTKERQQRNTKMLRQIIEMTHARGMNFTLGVWDHIYRGGVQGPKERATKPTVDVIWGLTADNLTDYTMVALAKFVKTFPEIDAIQFRMHGESGLKRGEMHDFWVSIYEVMLENAPQMRFDARAKNFPHDLIDKALDMGVDMRICTKYWMEQMGLPFHPTHIPRQNQRDRRHGYADMLRYPKRYDMHWRLWNSGTTRVLLWGDPEYARRFARSTHLYDGKGFEVSDPLTTKGQDHPHDMPVFSVINPKYRYYDWEFERQWHFFQVFGRIGYNPNTPEEVWQKQFEKRFGKDAGPHVEKALHLASGVLPMIVSYCHPYYHFPTTRGWAEKQRQGDLPSYAKVEGTDTQQFLSPGDAAKCIMEGIDSAKRSPERSSQWFAEISAKILEQVNLAEKKIGNRKNNEFISTLTDMKILANLAMYHSHRSVAGLGYALYTRSNDLNALEDAIAHESQAVRSWQQIVDSAGDVYDFDLRFGRRTAGLSGHWRDELKQLREGLEKLKTKREQYKPPQGSGRLSLTHVPVRKTAPKRTLVIRTTVGGDNELKSIKLVYGSKNVEMKQSKAFMYTAAIPAGDVVSGLGYRIESTDKSNRIVRFPADKSAIAVIVTDDNTPPAVIGSHITTAKPLKPLTISVQLSDPSGIKWARLRYRLVNQFYDYKTMEMIEKSKGSYSATVPSEDIDPGWDFMYFIEVMDNAGNGTIYPDLEKEAPYIIVKLQRD